MITVPIGQGDEPRINLSQEVLTFVNSSKVPTPPAVNAYQCERRPGHIILTVDMHPGVTPMFMSCKYPHCPGTAKSNGYPTGPVPEVLKGAPLWVWYRPNVHELVKVSRQTLEHVQNGGLLLRRCPQNIDQFMEEWNAHH